jgi:phospholipid/cholesterol/gamma-HCH transport system substrate-binding protein
MSKRFKLDILFGLFVVLGLAAVMFLALKAANLTTASEGETYRLSARFDNIGSLKARAPVRSAGVLVGRVKTIRLDPKSFQGVVELAVKRGFEFPKDTSARIQTAGLLGDQYIGLEPGGDTANLAPGDTITQTQSAVVLEKLLGQFLVGTPAGTGAPPGNTAVKKP